MSAAQNGETETTTIGERKRTKCKAANGIVQAMINRCGSITQRRDEAEVNSKQRARGAGYDEHVTRRPNAQSGGTPA